MADKPDILTVRIAGGGPFYVGRFMHIQEWAPETGYRCCVYDHATGTWAPDEPPARSLG